ncbi:MAG: AfsR/SARP family transcriptional regulator [Acidimicrobiia bacterium]|nr:AfsR/SARP family transcriptional regulator [Acidimicrobiia bacterium]
MDAITIRLLGPTVVTHAGREVEMGAPRERAVLALLALRAGTVVSSEVLIEQLWIDPPSGAATTLRGYVAAIRKAISKGTDLDGADVVVTKKPGYLLDVPAEQVDALAFGLLADDGRASLARGEYTAARKLLTEALELWRGDALSDFEAEEFAQEGIRRLSNRRLDVIEDKIEAEMALGEPEPIEELRALVDDHPFRERLIGHLMLALYRVGRQTEALRTYSAARKRFAEELGLEPTPRLRSLEEAILLQDPTLDAVARHPTRRSNLPVPINSLVGRERLAATVCATVEGSRLVTLTGPGGVGKTRLALEVAAQTQDDFVDGVVMVELAELHDGALVPEAITSALGIAEAPHVSGVAAAIAHLSGRRMLLLVDNCEHVLEAAARCLGPILEACPDLHVVATSRHSLGLPGERLVVVEPLEFPTADASHEAIEASPAVQLLVDRVGLVRPGFAISDHDAVAELVTMLDGLPLAIELAAAQFKALSARQVLERFADRLDIASDNPLAPGRHRSVHAAVCWSYELANDAERHLMDHLWVFRGGFDLDAAVAVSSSEDDLVGTLTALVASSLVDADFSTDPPRYSLLQTVAQVVSEMATLDLAQSLRDTHLTFFADRAASVLDRVSAVGPVAAEMLEPDEGNVQAAMAWSMQGGDRATGLALGLALVPYWDQRSKLLQGRKWLQQLAADPSAPSQLRAAAYVQSCAFAALTVPDGGLRDGEIALELYTELGDQRGLAATHRAIAALYVATGDSEQAREHLAVAADLAADVDASEVDIRTRYLESIVHRQAGDYESFAVSMRDLLNLVREHASPWDEAWINHQLAEVERRDGNHQLADDHAAAALETFRSLGDTRGESSALEMRSAVALSRGDLPGAVEYLADGLRLIARRGHHLASIHLLDHAAQIAARCENFELAAVLLGATQTRLETVAGAFHPEELVQRQGTLDTVAAALGPEVMATRMNEGRSLSLGDAAIRALSLVPS